MQRTLNIVLLSLALGASTLVRANVPIYNSNPGPSTPNLPSLGYQATSTAEFGELIQFAAGSRTLTDVVVSMSDWAKKSDWVDFGTLAGFNHDLTLNLYNVGAGNTVGSLIASTTVNAFIAWRPEAAGAAACPSNPSGYLASDGNCYNGALSQVTFNFAGVTVPDSIIYGLAFDTNTWGYHPEGHPGPYESLNFALNSGAPTVGSNPLPDTAYWNSAHAGFYTDGGAGGVGTFRQDTNWTPYNAAITFNATPEPGSILLLCSMLAGAVGFLKRSRS
jgi:hypothetical protein